MRIDEKFLHQLPAMFTCRDSKGGALVARPCKCYIKCLERFIKRHIRNCSTNQIDGNSLFSSEIILKVNIQKRLGPGSNAVLHISRTQFNQLGSSMSKSFRNFLHLSGLKHKQLLILAVGSARCNFFIA